MNSPIGSNNSITRTKTVTFSHNGYSEEIFKITQHAQALESDQDKFDHQSLVGIDSNQPPGFEKPTIKHKINGLDFAETLGLGGKSLEFQRQEDGLDIDELSNSPSFESPIDLVDPIRHTSTEQVRKNGDLDQSCISQDPST